MWSRCVRVNASTRAGAAQARDRLSRRGGGGLMVSALALLGSSIGTLAGSVPNMTTLPSMHPCSRRFLVSARVSIPVIPGMPCKKTALSRQSPAPRLDRPVAARSIRLRRAPAATLLGPQSRSHHVHLLMRPAYAGRSLLAQEAASLQRRLQKREARFVLRCRKSVGAKLSMSRK